MTTTANYKVSITADTRFRVDDTAEFYSQNAEVDSLFDSMHFKSSINKDSSQSHRNISLLFNRTIQSGTYTIGQTGSQFHQLSYLRFAGRPEDESVFQYDGEGDVVVQAQHDGDLSYYEFIFDVTAKNTYDADDQVSIKGMSKIYMKFYP